MDYTPTLQYSILYINNSTGEFSFLTLLDDSQDFEQWSKSLLEEYGCTTKTALDPVSHVEAMYSNDDGTATCTVIESSETLTLTANDDTYIVDFEKEALYFSLTKNPQTISLSAL